MPGERRSDMLKHYLSRLSHGGCRKLYALVKKENYARLQKMRFGEEDGYSYKPFDDTRSIFVHIPKAAGISVCYSLYGNRAGGHASIKKYQIVFSEGDFHHYFKFTFVRNPWDRLYSAYSFLKKGGMNNDDFSFAQKHLSKFANFEDFVLKWVSGANIRTYIHFMPQCHLLRSCTGKDLAVDFIGFYENLEDDFEFVKARVNARADLSHRNKTGAGPGYREIYTQEMIEIVGSVYARDIKLLGYNFDNSSLKRQLENRASSSTAAPVA